MVYRKVTIELIKMEDAKKTRFKIFLWDQFIWPFYLLLNLYQLQALLIALLILNFVIWKNITAFWVLAIFLAIIFVYQSIKYYQSGEFMHNYRKYKSEKGEYKDYRKAVKILKKEKLDDKKEEKILWAPEPIETNIKDISGILKKGTKEKEEPKITILNDGELSTCLKERTEAIDKLTKETQEKNE